MIKTITRFIFKILFFLALIGLLLGGALIWRLSQGPIVLDHATPYLVKILESQLFPGSKVTLSHGTFTLQALQGPHALDLQDVHIKDQAKNFEIVIPHLAYSGTFSFKQGAPFLNLKTLVLRNPQVSVFESKGEEVNKAAEKSMRNFFHALEETPGFFQEIPNFLKNHEVFIEVIKGEVSYASALKEALKYQFDLKYEQVPLKSLKGELFLKSKETLAKEPFKASFVIIQPAVKEPFRIEGKVSHISQKEMLFIKPLKEFFLIKSPLTLFLNGTFNAEGDFKEATLELEGGKGALLSNASFQNLLHYNTARLNAKLEREENQYVLTLKEALLEGLEPLGISFKKKLNLGASGVLKLSQQNMDLSLEAQAENIPFDHLKYLWPQGLGEDARSWVTENLSKGVADKATLSLKMQGSEFLKLQDLHGTIDLKEMTVTYMEGMPSVQGVEGQANYTNKAFNIHLHKGNTDQLKVLKGDVFLKDLDQENQFAEILLKINGPLKDALSLLDNPALNYIKRFGIDQETARGHAQVDLSLNFPLEHSLKPDQVKVKVTSDLKAVELQVPLSKETTLNLKEGDLKLTLEKGVLQTQGKASLNGVLATVLWQESLAKNLKSFYQLQAFMTSKDFNKLGLVIDPWIEFKDPLDLSLTAHKTPQEFKTEITLNLTKPKIIMPGFGWEKPADVESNGTVLLEGKGSAVSLKRLTFKAPDLNIEGKAYWENERLKLFSLEPVQVGNDSLKVTIVPDSTAQRYFIKVKGKQFNLHPLIDYYQRNKPQALKDTENSSNYDLTFELDYVPYLKDPALDMRQFKGKIIYQNDMLTFLKIEGKMPQDKNILASYQTNKTLSEGVLNVQLDNAGGVIQMLGLSESIKGGTLNLRGTRSLKAEGMPLKGQLVLKEFRVVDASILAQLFSLASLTGLFDLLSGQGIVFNEAETHFNYQDETLYIHKAQATSTALGLIGRGVIDLRDKNLNIKGTLIPMYFFNSVISRVPLIGELISGGEKEGLFAASYILKGNYDAPQIRVNPLSVLTPGFIRKIFFDDNKSLLPKEGDEEYAPS